MDNTTRLLTDSQGWPTALSLTSATLQITDGPQAGHDVRIDQPVFRIGSGPSNHLILNDASVSRYHLTLSTEPNGFVIRDLGSTNGVTIDGVSVLAAVLHSGAVVGLGRSRLRFTTHENRYELPLSERQELGGLVGVSPQMRRVFSTIETYAKHRHNVLIEGESGTGKEKAASALHTLSGRQPFVVVDCGSLTRDLITDALFGHVAGAFTSASAPREGAFSRANGGTLFLDEVGELPLDLQARLLRVVQERQFCPLGSDQIHRSDFRLIAATNKNLEAEVNAGTFRDDLFYRLATLRVTMPPLRTRPDDIPVLLDKFIREEMEQTEQPLRSFGRIPPAVIAKLKHLTWDGNVRQLKNYATGLVVRRDLGPLSDTDFSATPLINRPNDRDIPDAELAQPNKPAPLGAGRGFQEGKRAAIDAYERAYIVHYLIEAQGNVTQAAKLAGMHRQAFGRIMRRLDLRKETILHGPS